MASVQENATGVIQTAHFQREVLLRRCPFVSWLVNHRVQWWPGLPRLFICRAGGSDWGHTAEPDTGKGADDNLTATSTLRVLGRRRKNGPGHRRPHPTPSGRPSFRGTLFCGRAELTLGCCAHTSAGGGPRESRPTEAGEGERRHERFRRSDRRARTGRT